MVLANQPTLVALSLVKSRALDALELQTLSIPMATMALNFIINITTEQYSHYNLDSTDAFPSTRSFQKMNLTI